MTNRFVALSPWLLRIGVGGLVLGALGSMTSIETLRGLGASVVLFGTGLGCVLGLIADRSASPVEQETEGTLP
jgi:hypothetical protein